MSEVNIAPVIVLADDRRSGYIQKVKPQPLNQADIEMVALRLNVKSADTTARILDDVMVDTSGAKHPARRMIVELKEHASAPEEGAVAPDPVPKAKKRAGRPRKSKPAAHAAAE